VYLLLCCIILRLLWFVNRRIITPYTIASVVHSPINCKGRRQMHTHFRYNHYVPQGNFQNHSWWRGIQLGVNQRRDTFAPSGRGFPIGRGTLYKGCYHVRQRTSSVRCRCADPCSPRSPRSSSTVVPVPLLCSPIGTVLFRWLSSYYQWPDIFHGRSSNEQS